MPQVKIIIQHEAGLHARPLAMFVKVARGFEAEVQVSNISLAKGPANGKSPIELLTLSVLQGNEIAIAAEGPDADEALQAIISLVASNFQQPLVEGDS